MKRRLAWPDEWVTRPIGFETEHEASLEPKAAQPLEANAIEATFKHYVEAWRPTLGLSDWRVCVEALPDDKKFYASCKADPKYKSAKLRVNAARMAMHGFTERQVESTAVHELVHAKLWPLADEAANPELPNSVLSYFEETVTEEITAALLRAKYGDAHPELCDLWSSCAA